MKKILQICATLLAAVGLLCCALHFSRGGSGGKLTWNDPIMCKSLMAYFLMTAPGRCTICQSATRFAIVISRLVMRYMTALGFPGNREGFTH
jgi:hypothetical protein